MLNPIINIVFLLVIVAFSVRYYFQVQELPTFEEREVVEIVFWLLMLFVIVDMGSIILKFVSKKRERQKGKREPSVSERAGDFFRLNKQDLVLLLIFLLYLAAIPLFGFFISSFGFSAVVSYALGSRRIKELFLTPGIVLAVVYFFFVTLLNAKFPKGVLF
jgi:hypothetical protein